MIRFCDVGLIARTGKMGIRIAIEIAAASSRTAALRRAKGVAAGPFHRQEKSEKSLAMPTGIAKNGVILRALGGTMRKFKIPSRRSLPCLLVILAGAFLLLAAFAPRANADCPACIRFYDMEAPIGAYGVGQGSHMPALEQGDVPPFAFLLQNDNGTPYALTNVTGVSAPTVGATNFPAGAQPNVLSLGVHRSGTGHMNIVMTFPSAVGIYNIQSVSFASAGSGNGFQNVQLQASLDGGATWVNMSAVTAIPTAITTIHLNNTLGVVTLGVPNLLIRLNFINGQSNGTDLQNVIDNIQVNGTIVPEPATVASGLLGILGLCWHQRRRLRSLLPPSRRT